MRTAWAGLTGATWDEEEHPRLEKGRRGGGQFKGAGRDTTPGGVAWRSRANRFDVIVPMVVSGEKPAGSLGFSSRQEVDEAARRAKEMGLATRIVQHGGIPSNPTATWGLFVGGDEAVLEELEAAYALPFGPERDRRLGRVFGYSPEDIESFVRNRDYTGLVAATWDPAKHPRHEAGTETGGQLLADDMFALARSRTAVLEAMVAAGWDEGRHPREPELLKLHANLWFPDEPVKERKVTAGAWAEVSSSWNESEHPRAPSGSAQGGEFVTATGPFATDFPDGEFDPTGTVKFWPRKLGNLSGEPYWKALANSQGEELAFWFTDAQGRPHHSLMEKALGLPVTIRAPGREGLSGAGDEIYDSGYDRAAAEALVSRHRKDIKDARQMSEAMAAAGWDESEHPRWGKGGPRGGEFRAKESSSSFELPEEMQYKDTRRIQVKVGQAKNLREELEGWYYGQHGNDPEIQSILDNWGNWTTSELYRLRSELAKQLREEQPTGLLSGQYAKEIGRSLSQARNEARRLYEAVDKALTIEQLGLEKAMELYPELFEAKAPKVKQIDPRSQGIPDVYLSENGKFRPGYDAKLKSDLVNSALDLQPKTLTVTPIEPKPLSEQTISEVADWWKGRNADEQARQDWPDSEIARIAKYDPQLPNEIRRMVVADEGQRGSRVKREVKSTLLHRFEPPEALRILEERGWTSFLDQKRDALGGLLITDRDMADFDRARQTLEKTYGPVDIQKTPWSTKGNVNINGYHLGRVQELVGEMAEISPKIHEKLADAGVELYVGPGESTDLDEMWGIRDEPARNKDRRKMKQVAGFYSPSSKRVIVSSDSRYGSAALGAHEVGHAIGDVLEVDNHPSLATWHSRLKRKNMLGRYYLQHGNDHDGRQELWAEGVALHVRNQRYTRLSRTQIYKPRGPFKTETMVDTPEASAYMDWVARTLAELERGGAIPAADRTEDLGKVSY